MALCTFHLVQKLVLEFSYSYFLLWHGTQEHCMNQCCLFYYSWTEGPLGGHAESHLAYSLDSFLFITITWQVWKILDDRHRAVCMFPYLGDWTEAILSFALNCSSGFPVFRLFQKVLLQMVVDRLEFSPGSFARAVNWAKWDNMWKHRKWAGVPSHLDRNHGYTRTLPVGKQKPAQAPPRGLSLQAS